MKNIPVYYIFIVGLALFPLLGSAPLTWEELDNKYPAREGFNCLKQPVTKDQRERLGSVVSLELPFDLGIALNSHSISNKAKRFLGMEDATEERVKNGEDIELWKITYFPAFCGPKDSNRAKAALLLVLLCNTTVESFLLQGLAMQVLFKQTSSLSLVAMVSSMSIVSRTMSLCHVNSYCLLNKHKSLLGCFYDLDQPEKALVLSSAGSALLGWIFLAQNYFSGLINDWVLMGYTTYALSTWLSYALRLYPSFKPIFAPSMPSGKVNKNP